MLPSLVHLSGRAESEADSVREKWIRACGTRPTLAKWKNMRGKHKFRLLHSVASRADNDDVPGGDYVTAYEEVDIDDLFARRRRWSVEHVVPRSAVHGGEEAESDPLGWIEATARANSQRSNHPLVLWRSALPRGVHPLYGELHYAPPERQRARLARKWLFIRATYSDIDPPSAAQLAHAADIIRLAKEYPVQGAELRVNDEYRTLLRWANPLLEEGADTWYANVHWRALIFNG